MSRFRGQVAWITGASSGIGEAIAGRLADVACRLALTSRRAEPLQQAVAELSEKGSEVRAFAGDVTDRHRLGEIATEVENAWGGIDVLFACAGTYIPTEMDRFDALEFDLQMRINYGGAVNCIEAVLPGMRRRGRGYIVCVSSLTGYRGLPKAAAYGASKAALINFLESIRFELEPCGIKVTVVNPGFVKTPLTDKNEFKMPFLIDVDRAAEIVIKGMEKQKREIHFPAPFSWTLKLMRILPYPIYEWIIYRKVLKK